MSENAPAKSEINWTSNGEDMCKRSNQANSQVLPWLVDPVGQGGHHVGWAHRRTIYFLNFCVFLYKIQNQIMGNLKKQLPQSLVPFRTFLNPLKSSFGPFGPKNLCFKVPRPGEWQLAISSHFPMTQQVDQVKRKVGWHGHQAGWAVSKGHPAGRPLWQSIPSNFFHFLHFHSNHLHYSTSKGA